MTRKLLRVCLASLILSLWSFEAFAQAFEVDGIYYEVYNGMSSNHKDAAVVVEKPSGKYEGTIVLPDNVMHDGKSLPVLKVDYQAFKACDQLTSIDLNKVVEIDSEAFAECTALTSIDLKEVIRLGSFAFSSCSQLKDINFGKVAYMGMYALEKTAWFDNQPDGLVYASTVLYGYKGEMPKDAVLKVREDAEFIPSFAFVRAENLKSIDLANVKEIGSTAFYSCENLEQVKGLKVEEIGHSGFEKCAKLKDAELPMLQKVGESTFRDCSNLESLDMSHLSKVEGQAFAGTAWEKNQPDGVIYINNILYGYKGDFPKGTHLKVKDGVTEIVSFAFSQAKGLETIDLNQVVSIDHNAFSECVDLKRIDLAHVEKVDYDCFSDCPNLTQVDFGSIKELPSGMFKSCGSLKEINLMQVERIGYEAFRYCEELETVDFGNVHTIEAAAFANCRNLKDFDLKNVRVIENSVFLACFNLEHVDLKNVESLGKSVFHECNHLQKVNLGKITKLDDQVFAGCEQLKDIDLQHVTHLGNRTFAVCESLEKVDLRNLVSMDEGAFITCSNLRELHLPKIKELPRIAFRNCNKLQKVDLGAVERLGEGAFSSCLALSHIDLKGVTKIEDGVFEECMSMVSVDLQQVDSIGQGVFVDCKRLAYVKTGLKEPVTLVKNDEAPLFEPEIFEKAHLYVVEGAKNAYGQAEVWKQFKQIQEYFEVDHIFYAFNEEGTNAETATVIAYPGGYRGSLQIPASVNRRGQDFPVSQLANYALLGAELESLSLPASVNEISGLSFVGSHINSIQVEKQSPYFRAVDNVIYNHEQTKLISGVNYKGETFVVPSTVRELSESSFAENPNLRKVTISSAVSTIAPYAFSVCPQLTEVDLSNVTKIGASAFCFCDHLKKVSSKNVTEIGKEAFIRNRQLAAFDFGNIATIGEYAFYQCSELRALDLKEAVYVGLAAFSACNQVESLELYKLAEMAYGAFDCSGLKEIKCHMATPLKLDPDEYYFSYEAFDNAKLIVPEGSLDAYKNADVWNEFLTIQTSPEVTGIEEIEEQNSDQPKDVYDMHGRLVKRAATDLSGLPHGIYIVGGEKIVW